MAWGQTAAQAAPAAAPANTQPVDIQADEQEFAEGKIIAKGNVRVSMKDTVVVGPEATLFRDASGQAQRAVFIGHPHLIQSGNKIDANTLTFEMATQHVIADGNAHSEVLQDDETPPPAAAAVKPAAPVKGKAMAAKPAAGKKGEIVWPTKKSDEANDLANADSATGLPEEPPKPAAPVDLPYTDKGSAGKAKVADKIITDADHQEYERDAGRFEATGHVRVRHAEIFVKSDKLQMVYSADGKPETALFNGNVNATQNDNNTVADHMTYFLSTQRLQATGNVKSKVIQKKAEGAKKGGPTEKEKQLAAQAAAGPPPPDAVKTKFTKKSDYEGSTAFDAISQDSGDPILISSDAQDYDKDNGNMNAQGNVHLIYGTTTGTGPKVVLYRNADGDAEKVIFTGRSLVNQPGKRWIGDKITMNVADHHVLAEGNTRAIILQNPATVAANSPTPLTPAEIAPAKGTKPGTTTPARPSSDASGSKLADHKSPTI